MPLVKPITTGRGMYFTAVPRPVMPSSISITPAINVHMNSPSRPYVATMPDTTTTNAPVGPPICTREPPRAEIVKPAMAPQYRPVCGGSPEAMANAIASGRATRPTVTPAMRSAASNRGEYPSRQHSTSLGRGIGASARRRTAPTAPDTNIFIY